MATPTEDEEFALVTDGLGVDRSSIERISREPLGSGTVSGYRVAGDQARIAYLDTSQVPVPAETGLAIPGVARLWVHPADPHLPALAAAAFGHAARVLLGRIGMEPTADPEMVAYRPGKRAVLRVQTTTGLAWVKVVRPRRVDAIVAAHTSLLAAGVPVPAVRGWAPEGILVIDEAAGTPATEVTWDPEQFLDAVDELRAALGRASLDQPARVSLRSRVPWYTERLRRALPLAFARIDHVAGVLETIPEDEERSQVIHGDLHLGQLFLDPSGTRVTGLVDVDTAGMGDPDDDIGAFIAHAVASTLLTTHPAPAAALWHVADRAWSRWVRSPGARAAVTVQLLGHALGAVELGDPDRADLLLRSAERAVQGESPIRAVSSPASDGLRGRGQT